MLNNATLYNRTVKQTLRGLESRGIMTNAGIWSDLTIYRDDVVLRIPKQQIASTGVVQPAIRMLLKSQQLDMAALIKQGVRIDERA